MNKSVIRFLVGCFMFINAATTQAAGWTGEQLIVSIYPNTSTGVFVSLLSMPNPDGCATTTLYFLDKNHPLFNQIFSLLVSAKARTATINLQLVGCAGQSSAYPSIQQMISSY